MMKRLVTLLLFAAAATTVAVAQDADADRLRAEIIAAGEKIAAIDCDFVQTRESAFLAEKAVSSGHMTYRKPGYLVWKYTDPFPLTFSMDGQTVTLEREGRTESLDGSQGRLVKEMVRMIIGNIEGSVFRNEKVFTADLQRLDGAIVATLHPQNKEVRKLWSKLILVYDARTLQVLRFEMIEPSGDLTDITFNHVKYDLSE